MQVKLRAGEGVQASEEMKVCRCNEHANKVKGMQQDHDSHGRSGQAWAAPLCARAIEISQEISNKLKVRVGNLSCS